MENKFLSVYALKRLKQPQPIPLGQKPEMGYTSETPSETTNKQFHLSYETQLLYF